MVVENGFLILNAGISTILLIAILFGEWRLGKKEKWNIQIAKRVKRECSFVNILSDIEIPINKNMWNGRQIINIDLLILYGNDIYVLYLVDVDGYVYGHEVTKIWWSVNGTKKKFLNPLEVSYMQAEAVKEIVPKEMNVIPVIVFKQTTNTSYLDVSEEEIKILHEREIAEYIKQSRTFIKKKTSKNIYKQLLNANEKILMR